MSLFYKTLTYAENLEFQKRKRLFKEGKPCAICGKTFALEEMAVAHLIPVRELTNKKALFDEKNWQVRCIYCERKLHHEEQLAKNLKAEDQGQIDDDPKVEFLQNKRQKVLQNRRQYKNIQSAEREIQLRRLSNSGRRGRRQRRKRQHQNDDYYRKFERD